MAGSSVTVTTTQVNIGQSGKAKYVKKVSVAWTADASDGSVPITSIELDGWLVKAVTIPGSTAPTASYNVKLYDPDTNKGTKLSALGTQLDGRSATADEQVYTAIATTPAVPVLLAGSYGFQITSNSVNSATGLVVFYICEEV